MALTEKLKRKMKTVAERIVSIESKRPGIVRMRVNPFKTNEAASLLKLAGLKKTFFQSSTQFLYNSFLIDSTATELILPYTLFTGDEEEPGHISCWNGVGEYAGWQGHFQLADFNSGKKERLVLIVDCSNFLDEFSDLFDAPPSNK